ncbi:hypothetical protein NKI09_28715 [Mesorhizobium sp. M0757]|uniref:hypothetical protein n=1 Tax=unclassified Mesorhizobium TaxID=325217 RepID=UPI00333CB6EE
MIVASFGTFGPIWSATARPCVIAASGVLAFGGLIAAQAFDSNTIIADLNERGEPRSSSRSIRGAPCRCLSISNSTNGVISSITLLQTQGVQAYGHAS